VFLAGIAKELQSKENIKYSLLNGNILLPTLLIYKDDFVIQLLPVPSPLVFKISRFAPKTMNVRYKYFFGSSNKTEGKVLFSIKQVGIRIGKLRPAFIYNLTVSIIYCLQMNLDLTTTITRFCMT